MVLTFFFSPLKGATTVFVLFYLMNSSAQRLFTDTFLVFKSPSKSISLKHVGELHLGSTFIFSVLQRFFLTPLGFN